MWVDVTVDGCGGMGYRPITSEADCLSAGADGDLFDAAGVVSPDQGAIIVEGSQDPGTITQGSQRECIVLHNPESPSTSYLYLAELELVSCGGTVTRELWQVVCLCALHAHAQLAAGTGASRYWRRR